METPPNCTDWVFAPTAHANSTGREQGMSSLASWSQGGSLLDLRYDPYQLRGQETWWVFNGYLKVEGSWAQELTDRGYEPGVDLFLFPYDWLALIGGLEDAIGSRNRLALFVEWTRVSSQAAFDGSLDVAGDGQVHLFDVVATDSELVAAGFQSFGDPVEGTDGERAVVVVSRDGVTWDRVSDPDLEPPSSGGIRIEGLADIGNGLLAVGSTLDPVVWVSPDGRDWSILYGRPEAIGYATMRDAARVEAGLIAVGNAREQAGIWISTYGPEWIRLEGPAFSTQGIMDVMSVTSGPRGVVAVGNERFQLPDGHSDWDAAVWVSGDGGSWTRIHDEALVWIGSPGRSKAEGDG